ncbi:protein phosphatase 2C domain-containing protein [Streptomyces sp. NPDC046197]|uniref:protein phosphatase 2C domain-containing protein n=1 Tax=Streptomyces sp. NPDC046197 TaxID=3154337 RepID=UPI0034079633
MGMTIERLDVGRIKEVLAVEGMKDSAVVSAADNRASSSAQPGSAAYHVVPARAVAPSESDAAAPRHRPARTIALPAEHTARLRPEQRRSEPPHHEPAYEHPRPPVFGGRHTAAYRSPWKLPARPVQTAVAADDANLGDLGVLAASVVGTGHRCAEPAEPRQDAYRIARDEAGRHLVVAVADGISACRFSDLGAQVAATTAVNAVRSALGDLGPRDPLELLDARHIFQQVAQQMQATAKQRGVSIRDVGVVLITAVVPTQGTAADGSRAVWVARVGDVSAWHLQNKLWQPFVGGHKRQHGGVESGEVDAALPWAPQAVEARSYTVTAGSTLAFVTDGIGDALHDNPALNSHFAQHWAGKPPVTSFLTDMHFDAPSCQDDRTAVVVWTDR